MMILARSLCFLSSLVGGDDANSYATPDSAECGRPPADWIEEYEHAVRTGLVVRPIPVAQPLPLAEPIETRDWPLCLSPEHIFLYEDTRSRFKETLTHAQRLALMTDAANQLIATHGDHFDFIGFFLSFKAKNPLGAAFYQPIFNDVSGIGDPLANGQPLFDTRELLGLGSDRVQGYLMMWGIKQWEGGAQTPLAHSTRLTINHEFGHRFACFLPPLLDGRAMQANGSCGTSGHWNGQVDAQASCLLIGEWISSNPAVRSFAGGWFNRDIPRGVFSWFELYLMGYASPFELDHAPSELRFISEPSCQSPSFAPISTIRARDVVAAAGPRLPGVAHSQKDYRAAWIMIHLPGKLPDEVQLGIAVSVLEQQPVDWAYSTLGRGTMRHALFEDLDCDGRPDPK